MTILALVLAYDVDPVRTWWQSLAFAMVVALVAQPATGFLVEAFFSKTSGLRLSVVYQQVPQCDPQLIEQGKQNANECLDFTESAIPGWGLIGSWLVITFLVLCTDRMRAEPKTKPGQIPAHFRAWCSRLLRRNSEN